MILGRFICLLLLTFYFSLDSYSQGFNPFLKSITVEEGLTQNTVTDITQDYEGFIWIATEDGINRFDGFKINQFRRFPHNTNKIIVNRVRELNEFPDSTLWLKTIYTDLSYTAFTKPLKFTTVNDKFPEIDFSEKNVILIEHDSRNNTYLSLKGDSSNQFIYYNKDTTIFLLPECKNHIAAFCEDTDNNIWISNNYDKIYKINFQDKFPIIESEFSFVQVNDILKCSDGSLYFISDKTIYKKNPDAKIEEIYTIKTDDKLVHAFIDSENNLWGSFNRQSFFYCTSNTFDTVQFHKSIYTSDYYISSIVEDNQGNIWLGTTGNGIHVYNKNLTQLAHIRSENNVPNGLNHNYITKLYKDRKGNIWIGTLERGVNLYSPMLNKFNHVSIHKSHLSNEQILIRDIKQHKNTLWFATRGHGIHGYNLKTNSIRTLFENSPFHFEALYFDGDSVIWIGTRNQGILHYNVRTGKLLSINDIFKDTFLKKGQNYVRNIYADKQNNLWFCTWGGLIFLDKARQKMNEIVFNNNNSDDSKGLNYAFTILQYTDSTYLIGTEAGVALINRNGDISKRFTFNLNKQEALPNNTVFNLYKDSTGKIWAGTFGGGFCNIDVQSGEINTYNNTNGLSNDCVYGILEDNSGNLWISTNNGLNCFNPETKTFKVFYKTDGLPSNAFNFGSFFNSGNQLWYWTEGGIVSFSPKQVLMRNSMIFHLAITDFEVLNTDKKINYFIQNNYSAVLNPGESTFKVKMVSPTFNYNDKVNYEYKITPLQSEWINHGTDGNFIFNKLPYGKFTMHFRVESLFGEQNPELSIPLTIKPPFVKTIYFKFLLLIICLSVISAIIYIRFRQLKKLEKVRLQIANDLHDEIGSTISNLSFLGFQLSGNKIEKSELKNHGTQIQELSKKVADSIKEVLWLINPGNDHISQTLKKMEALARQLFTPNILYFEFAEEIPDPGNLKIKRNLLLIYKELLNNIAKHSNAKQVSINIRFMNNTFILTIFDDGIGFDSAQRSSGLGLASIKKRVKEINGKLEIDSKPGKGSLFIIKIPAWKKRFRLLL